MKILVASDNHGNLDCLEDLIHIYKDEIDLWLHCGDSEFSASEPIWDTFKTVSGNMDFDRSLPDARVETINDKNFVVVHGHRHQVKISLNPLAELAQANNAEVAFYGHTHIAKVDIIDGIAVINPGSIIQPRGDLRVGTYAIYEENAEGSFVKFYDWNHNEVDELSQKLK